MARKTETWASFTSPKWLLLILAAPLALSTPSLCLAFDTFPEFHSLTESEALRFDETKLIDSEYQSDVITYLKPLSWDAEFHSAKNAFDFTLGSLSSNLFLQHTRLKLAKELVPGLGFRFTYFQQRDLDVDQTHAVLELVKDIGPHLAVSLYGEPSFYKRENDLGAAVLIRPARDHEIRLFYTLVDLTRQAHSDRPDSYVDGHEPKSMGLVGRCEGCLGPARETGVTEFAGETATTESRIESNWLEYFIRWEPPTEWRFPNEQYEYDYQNLSIGASTRLAPKGQTDVFYNFRLQASRKREAFKPLSAGSSATDSALDRKLFESLASVEFPAFSSRTRLEPGLGWFHRFWRGHDDVTLEHRNLLPFLWLIIDGPAHSGGRRDKILLGYEVTFFDSEGSLALAPSGLKPWIAEHRVNFRYEFHFNDDALLSFALAGDPDSAVRGSGGLFEGGNGQFKVYF